MCCIKARQGFNHQLVDPNLTWTPNLHCISFIDVLFVYWTIRDVNDTGRWAIQGVVPPTVKIQFSTPLLLDNRHFISQHQSPPQTWTKLCTLYNFCKHCYSFKTAYTVYIFLLFSLVICPLVLFLTILPAVTNSLPTGINKVSSISVSIYLFVYFGCISKRVS